MNNSELIHESENNSSLNDKNDFVSIHKLFEEIENIESHEF